GDDRRAVFSVAAVQAGAMTKRVLLLMAVVAFTTKLAARPAQRVVSLIPAVTEMIFAMGEGTRLVGVSSYDHYPPQVEQIERVGALLDPNIERILALRPDLLVIY